MKVTDDDPDDDLDKSISKYELKELTESLMEIHVSFNDHSAISENISEPDLLEVEFLLPGLFLDAETLLPLD